MSQRPPVTVPSSRRTPDEGSAAAARLALTASVPAPGHVDGAWWPRSTDLVAELPALLEAVHDRTGDVVIVAFHRGAWQPATSRMDISGESILLEGFTNDDPHTLLVIGSSGQRLTLTVLAPDSAKAAALTELASASSAESAADAGTAGFGNARSLAEVGARLAATEDHTDERRTQTIERWVRKAAVHLVDAPVQAFVPVLVEHIVRQQMDATSTGDHLTRTESAPQLREESQSDA